MRKIIFPLIAICILIFILASLPSFVQSTKEVEKMGVKELVELMKSPDWKERDLAITYGLKKFRKVDEKGFPGEFNKFEGEEEIKIALIELLERENLANEEWSKEYEKVKGNVELLTKKLSEKFGPGEGHGEYYGNLVFTVIALKDKRAIKALTGAYVGSIREERAVAEFGEEAVAPLINRFNESINSGARMGVIRILDIMIKEKTLLETTKNKIRAIFIQATKDKKHLVRIEGIKALGNLGDKESISIIESMVKDDPYSFVHVKTKKRVYPVREEAEKILKKIKENK